MDPIVKSQLPGESNVMYANYLHDLESILWIIIWTLLKYQKNGTDLSSDPNQTIRDRVRLNKDLFSNVTNFRLNRTNCISINSHLLSNTRWTPEYFQPLRSLADSFRQCLFTAYCNDEKGFKVAEPIRPPPEGSVHQLILNIFRELRMDGFGVTPIDYKELTLILPRIPLIFKQVASDRDTVTKETKKAK